MLGMAMQPLIMRDVIDGIHPGLLRSATALNALTFYITRIL